jgi:hypothetical protein
MYSSKCAVPAVGVQCNAHRTGTTEVAVVQLPSPQVAPRESWATSPRSPRDLRLHVSLASHECQSSLHRHQLPLHSIELMPSIRNLFQEANPMARLSCTRITIATLWPQDLDLPSIFRCHRTKRYGETSWLSPPCNDHLSISLTYNHDYKVTWSRPGIGFPCERAARCLSSPPSIPTNTTHV